MSINNRGTAGATYELTELNGALPPATTVPPATATTIQWPVSGAINDSPKSAAVLLDSPEFLYDVADKVDGVSWANSGTVVGSDLTYVNEPTQEVHIHFPGAIGNQLQIPDDAALDLDATTEMEIVVRMAADWHNESIRQVIVAKKTNTGQSYELAINGGGSGSSSSGYLVFKTAASVSDSVAVCREAVPFMPWETGWVKVTWNNTDNKVHYYVSTDKATEPVGAEWREIGATSNASHQTSAAAVVANTQPLFIGGIAGLSAALTGRVYYMAIRNAIGGADVFTLNVPIDCAATVPDVDVSFTSTSGHTVSINKSGTPPNTCRLHNTLDVVLEFPWYEVTLPTELNVDPGECLLIWVKMTGTLDSAPNTRVPLVSVFGIRDGYHSGYAVWYSIDVNKIGTYIPSSNGFPTGNPNNTTWSTALGTGPQNVVAWLNRIASVNPLWFGMTLGVHNGTTDYGGLNAYYAVMSSGMVMPDSTYGKLRILSPEDAPFDITQVGFKLTDPPPIVVQETSTLAWDNTIRDHAKALSGLEPTWDTGESFHVNTPGTPTWFGSHLPEGTWVVAETGGAESAVVWGNHTESSGVVWTAPIDMHASIGSDLVLAVDQSALLWVVVSGLADGVYRDYIDAYDSTTLCYVGIGMTKDPGAPYLYFEIDGPTEYQWGEFNPDPSWTVPENWEDPIIVALWLERTAPAMNDRVWGYATGLPDWVEGANEPVFKPGVLTIGSSATMLREIDQVCVWGFGIDLDIETAPTTEYIDQILTDVIIRNSSQ